MKKAVASILLAIMISSIMMVDAKKSLFANHPLVRAGSGNVQCVINIMPRMGEIATNPVGVFMEFSACAGDQTWDLLAPFIGGFMRAVLTQINSVIPES